MSQFNSSLIISYKLYLLNIIFIILNIIQSLSEKDSFLKSIALSNIFSLSSEGNDNVLALNKLTDEFIF